MTMRSSWLLQSIFSFNFVCSFGVDFLFLYFCMCTFFCLVDLFFWAGFKEMDEEKRVLWFGFFLGLILKWSSSGSGWYIASYSYSLNFNPTFRCRQFVSVSTDKWNRKWIVRLYKTNSIGAKKSTLQER